MHKGSCSLPIIFLSFLFFFLSVSSAFANVPIAWVFIGANAPLSYGVFGFAVVVFIEVIIFWRFFKISCIKAITLAISLNIISTVVGFLISVPNALPAYTLFFPFIGFYMASMARKRGAPWSFYILSIIAIIIGVVGALMNYIRMPPTIPVKIYIALVLPLFLGFGLTILIEGMAVNRYFKSVVSG